jgi:hypothetical protein
VSDHVHGTFETRRHVIVAYLLILSQSSSLYFGFALLQRSILTLLEYSCLLFPNPRQSNKQPNNTRLDAIFPPLTNTRSHASSIRILVDPCNQHKLNKMTTAVPKASIYWFAGSVWATGTIFDSVSDYLILTSHHKVPLLTM